MAVCNRRCPSDSPDRGLRRPSETLDVYVHLWPYAEDRTRQAVDELLGSHFAEDRAPRAGVKIQVRGVVTVSRPISRIL